jgi:MADS-box transcription factor
LIDRHLANYPIPQACLNAPEPAGDGVNGVEGEPVVESPEEPAHAPLPTQHTGMQQRGGMPNTGYMNEQQQRAMAYQSYMAQQQQQVAGGGYPMPQQAGMAQHPPQG